MYTPSLVVNPPLYRERVHIYKIPPAADKYTHVYATARYESTPQKKFQR